MRIVGKINKDIDDHWIVLCALIGFILLLYLDVHYEGQNNCHLLEPAETCDGKYMMNIQDLQNNTQWADESALSIHGYIEYRQLPQFGYGHCEFNYSSPIGLCHTDSYNALDFPLGTFAHLSDWLGEYTHLVDWANSVIIWGVIFFGGYEAGKWIYRVFKN